MRVIRPVKLSDLKALQSFAERSGVGMTHLPNQETLLRSKLQNSIASFTTPSGPLPKGDYLFVLTNSDGDQPGGTCGINASAGSIDPFHVFSVEKMPSLSPRIPPSSENRLLKLKAYQNGPTEICALFLLPELRSGGWGKLLSWSRFLFMASFPDRFQSVSFANMRGFIENNSSIFWDGLGRCFLNMDFAEMMKFRLSNQIQASEIFPNFPIPVALLSKQAQQAIGEVYAQSKPALAMLLAEGFAYAHEIDPYDGGPIIKANTADILAVKNSVIGTVSQIEPTEQDSRQAILCNAKLDFRACYGSVKVISGNNIALANDVASALQVNVGDNVRYLDM